jgi:outer membrane immunogenic protein
MKNVVIAATMLLIAGGAATAADMPVKALPLAMAYSWSGCYVGANVGIHRGRDSITTTSSVANFAPGGAVFLDSISPTSYQPQGIIGGVQGGCNVQYNSIVVGVEADADWLGGSSSRILTVGAGAPVAAGDFLSNSTNATFLSTVRGRVGFAADRTLFFVTGGLAIGTIKTTDSFAGFGGTDITTASVSRTKVGWTIGGGVEHALASSWTVKAEYLYVDLGSFDAAVPCRTACIDPINVTVHHRYTDNIFRLGVNYKFGGPIVARY